MHTLLSNKALPHLTNLMKHFNLALRQEMAFYTKYKDSRHFARVLNYLGQDFAYFAAHLYNWQYETDPNTLKPLELQLEESRDLITQSTLLLDRRHAEIRANN